MYRRPILMCLDALSTVAMRPKRKVREHLQLILRKRSRRFDKVSAAASLMDHLFPGLLSSLLERSRCRRLPFRSSDLRPLNFGSGSTVFQMQIQDRLKVIKILRRSLGRDGEELIGLVNEFRARHQLISSWYNRNGMALVPAAHYLVLHGPLVGWPVAAAVQDYLGGETKDPFRDLSEDELYRLLNRDQALGRQFKQFAEVTWEHFAGGQMCLDLAGQDNLILMKEKNRWRLVILDAGIFDLKKIRIQHPQAFARLETNVLKVRAVLKRLSDGPVERLAI